jgi:hypothetical protein
MKNLSKAIVEVQKTVKNLEKNSRVGFGSGAYDGTKMFDVMIAFNSAMSKNGLSILTTEINDDVTVNRWEENNRSKQQIFVSLKVKYLLLHTSGESIELCGYGHGVDSQDKASGKALTYALKNILINTFLTPVGKIEDTDETHSDSIPVPVQKTLPTLPKNKFSDVAKFIETGIGTNGKFFPPSERWSAIELKYNISKKIKTEINDIVKIKIKES